MKWTNSKALDIHHDVELDNWGYDTKTHKQMNLCIFFDRKAWNNLDGIGSEGLHHYKKFGHKGVNSPIILVLNSDKDDVIVL